MTQPKRVELKEVLDLLDTWIKQQTVVNLFRIEYVAEHECRVAIEVTRGRKSA